MTPPPTDHPSPGPSPTIVVTAAARSARLQSRRLELLPLRGPDAVFTDVQGRGWGTDTTTSPAELADLISSIATCGLLQPVLVERLPDTTMRLAAGHRRLRAMRWGAVNLADNPHFGALPANVVDGPLTDEELRVWQLVENLARTDLKPGELAAALLYERCAVLAAAIADAGVELSDDVTGLDDPTQRWRAIDAARTSAGLHQIGAPWDVVIGRLGLELSPDKAKKLVAAFRAMPPDLAADMDDHDITLASRLEWIRLDRGRTHAADGIWAAIKARGRTDLLTRACREARTGDFDVDDAIGLAQAVHDDADDARRTAALNQPATISEADSSAEVPDEVVDRIRSAITELLDHLDRSRLGRYDYGSLVLLVARLHHALADNDGGDASA